MAGIGANFFIIVIDEVATVWMMLHASFKSLIILFFCCTVTSGCCRNDISEWIHGVTLLNCNNDAAILLCTSIFISSFVLLLLPVSFVPLSLPEQPLPACTAFLLSAIVPFVSIVMSLSTKQHNTQSSSTISQMCGSVHSGKWRQKLSKLPPTK